MDRANSRTAAVLPKAFPFSDLTALADFFFLTATAAVDLDAPVGVFFVAAWAELVQMALSRKREAKKVVAKKCLAHKVVL